MNDLQATAARVCLAGAYDATMDFPTIIGTLIGAGFEGYSVDYRQNKSAYYLATGGGIDLPLPAEDPIVAAEFDAEQIREAIREAQSGSASYSYMGFCRKVKAAGCAGYIVSFPGRRVVYYGRSGETHVEHFPNR